MTLTVLVIDNLEPNILILESKLSNNFYNVLSATSGQEALSMIANYKVDAIILDLILDDINGLDLIAQFKINPKILNVPILVISALSSDETKLACLEAGAEDFFSKPIIEIELITRLKACIKFKTLIDELVNKNEAFSTMINNNEYKPKIKQNPNVVILCEEKLNMENICSSIQEITSSIHKVQDYVDMDSIVRNQPIDLFLIYFGDSSNKMLKVCSHIFSKEKYKKVPAIILSDTTNIHNASQAIEYGLNDYIHYPATSRELFLKIQSVLKKKSYHEILELLFQRNVHLAMNDSLTGLYNRRYFDATINKLHQQYVETSVSFGLIMVDLDFFKKVNDTYGHKAGDAVLIEIAKIIKHAIDIKDTGTRYGGEEFFIITQDGSTQYITELAQKIYQTIKDSTIHYADFDIKITASIGVAKVTQSDTVETLIERVDKLLYKAKNTGRDQVCLSDEVK